MTANCYYDTLLNRGDIMPKIEMTLRIGIMLKELRVRYGVKSKEVAKYLDKSPAYISKLEKGGIKTIKREELNSIIDFISNGDFSYEEFLEELSLSVSNDEMGKMTANTWFFNFDTIERQIPISKEFINYISNKMHTLSIDPLTLIEYINKNEDLEEAFLEKQELIKSDVNFNTWYSYKEYNYELEKYKFFIYLKYSVKELEDLLSYEKETCSHTFVFALVYHLLKIEYSEDKNIELEKLKREATDILKIYHIYTLSERNRLLIEEENIEKLNSILNKFDVDNQRIVSEIIGFISYLSDSDVKYTNEKLEVIKNNLKQNPSFTLNYMAVPLKQLFTSSKELRGEFIKDIENLVEKYSQEQKENPIETY